MREYIEQRLREGAAPATTNRELAALRRAFSLGIQADRIQSAPRFSLLPERNVRKGFVEPHQLKAILHHLPEDIKPVVEFAAITGWRLRECLALTWTQLDFAHGTVRLEPNTTKTSEGRMFPMTGDLRKLLEARRVATDTMQRTMATIVPYVFARERGRPIKSLRRAWITASRRAGVPGALFHDLRRGAVRALVGAGVAERVAMQMTGHRTRAIFDRYHIVSDADLREAASKLDAGRRRAQNGHNRQLWEPGAEAK